MTQFQWHNTQRPEISSIPGIQRGPDWVSTSYSSQYHARTGAKKSKPVVTWYQGLNRTKGRETIHTPESKHPSWEMARVECWWRGSTVALKTMVGGSCSFKNTRWVPDAQWSLPRIQGIVYNDWEKRNLPVVLVLGGEHVSWEEWLNTSDLVDYR